MTRSGSRATGAVVLAVGLALEVLAAGIVVAQATGGTKTYYKVNPSFPPDLNTKCLLQSMTLPLKVSCASLCNALSDCRLFCTDGAECQTFSAKVSLHWEGVEGTSPAPSRLCYSSYANPSNIAHDATISATEELNDRAAKEFAVVGYNCFVGFYYQYTSRGGEANAWWAADLGEPRAISSVVIGSKQLNPTDFQDIEIRVGFVSGAGDFSANSLLDTYAGPAEPRQLLVFKAITPLVGSVVSVQRMSDGALTFNSVQIIAD